MTVGEAVEDGGDVGLWIQTVQLRGFRDGVDDRGPLPTSVATDEQEIFSRNCNSAQQPLRQIVVDREPAVLDMAHQSIPAIERILQRLAERRLTRQPAPLLQYPRVQRLQQRLALRLARRAALLGRLAVDRRLDGIELADPPQRLFGDRRLG